MKHIKCPLCNGKEFSKVRGSEVRDNPKLKVMKCKKCSIQFLNTFDHMNDKFYEDSKMFTTDERFNLKFHLIENRIDNKRRVDYLKLRVNNKTILDFGCGNGGFLNGIKKYCKSCEGIEKDINHYKKFKRDKLIKIYSDISEVKKKYDFITLFHVIEHLKNPVKMLKHLSQLLKKGGKIIIETPNSNDALLSKHKVKEFLKFYYTSHHLFIFNNKSLKKLITKSKLKLNLSEQVQRYNLQNHFGWINDGKPGGHLEYKFVKDFPKNINKEYEKELKKSLMCDTLFFEVSK